MEKYIEILDSLMKAKKEKKKKEPTIKWTVPRSTDMKKRACRRIS